MDIMVPVCCDGGFCPKCNSGSDFAVEEDIARESAFSWMRSAEGCGRTGKISMVGLVAACCRHASTDETWARTRPESRCPAMGRCKIESCSIIPGRIASSDCEALRQCQNTNRQTRPTKYFSAIISKDR